MAYVRGLTGAACRTVVAHVMSIWPSDRAASASSGALSVAMKAVMRRWLHRGLKQLEDVTKRSLKAVSEPQENIYNHKYRNT